MSEIGTNDVSAENDVSEIVGITGFRYHPREPTPAFVRIRDSSEILLTTPSRPPVCSPEVSAHNHVT